MSSSIDELDLPKLQSIQLDQYSLEGDQFRYRETISSESYNDKNTLTMRSENAYNDE